MVGGGGGEERVVCVNGEKERLELSVGDGIADDALEEGLQDTTGLLVDHCDTLGLHWWDGRVKVAYWLRYA
jgi:hypothetical protein